MNIVDKEKSESKQKSSGPATLQLCNNAAYETQHAPSKISLFSSTQNVNDRKNLRDKEWDNASLGKEDLLVCTL